jgi:hypothetical protein
MKPNITIEEKYAPAMQITDQAEADAYFEILVQHSMDWGQDHASAVAIEKSNLGYYAGYYDEETRHRVEKLFRCVHPYFGGIADVGAPTSEEAMQIGFDMGRRDADKQRSRKPSLE